MSCPKLPHVLSRAVSEAVATWSSDILADNDHRHKIDFYELPETVKAALIGVIDAADRKGIATWHAANALVTRLYPQADASWKDKRTFDFCVALGQAHIASNSPMA